ncbi:MAG: DinB family protein [Sphingobacteriaceae bacterium]|nr:MAG: DinB family protein [Sphingobacteriaceae bacterium]
MIQQIKNIKIVRTTLLTLIEDLTTEQLNKIPEGFNNNIIWNVAHLTAAQQGLCYKRAALQPVVQEKYLSPYLPGTKPEHFVDAAEIETIKILLLSTIDELESDYKKSFFTNYTAFTTRYGVEISSIDDAIHFLPFHEGLHSGAIMALKKLVQK